MDDGTEPSSKLLFCNMDRKSKENDYRQILQNLVEDLLITLNLPEWPASEVHIHKDFR
jgi:hypothetical protein